VALGVPDGAGWPAAKKAVRTAIKRMPVLNSLCGAASVFMDIPARQL
jgi:hypothetical protein